MFKNMISPARRCNKFAVLKQLNKAKAERDLLLAAKTPEPVAENSPDKEQRPSQQQRIETFCNRVQQMLEESVFFYENDTDRKRGAKKAPLDMIVQVGTNSASECEPKHQNAGSTLFLRVRYVGDAVAFSKQTERAVVFALKKVDENVCTDATMVVVIFHCKSKIDLRLQQKKEIRLN